jgi:nucleoside-diphosphate kinase
MGHKTGQHVRSLILLKPDAVQRGLMGEIISRFERKGLKIVAMKMAWPNQEQASEHYAWSDEEKIKTGTRTTEAYKQRGVEVTETPLEIGTRVCNALKTYLAAGPILAMVIEGAHAIEHVRKLVGNASPLQSDVGTIRADFATDSYALADEGERATRNLVHASSSVDEAERELKVWFNEEDIYDYELPIEQVLYSKDWEIK